LHCPSIVGIITSMAPSNLPCKIRIHLLAAFLLFPIAMLSVAVSLLNAEEQRVTLDEAIRIALENNYEIRAFRSSVAAQSEGVGVARSYLLPRLFVEERAARTNNPPTAFMMKLNQQRFSQDDFAISSLNNPRPITDYQTMFSIEQPIFAMKPYLDFTLAKLEYSAKGEELRRKAEEIAFKVVQAYLRARTAREYLGVSGKAIEDAREHLRIAESRYRNGLGLYSDLLRAKTALTEAEQKQVSSTKETTVAKKWLGFVLGKPTTPLDPSDEPLDIPLMDVDYYTTASLSRKDIAAMRMRHEGAKTNIKRAESMYLPSVGVGGSYQLNDHSRVFGSEGDSWYVMAYLRWNLFDGLQRESERRKAQHQETEAKEQLSSLTHFVSFKVQEAYLAIEETRKNAHLALDALRTAEEGKRLVKERYENSLSPMVDLLDVQLSVNRARADAIARENEHKLAIVTLSYESGTILKNLGVE
jgi:outer membrane protein